MVTRRSTHEDQGFTLIELLAVVVVIGILASIAIPVFLGQRAKAAGAASESDLNAIGKRIAEYYVGHAMADPVPTVVIPPGRMMTVGGEDVAVASDGVELLSVTGTGAFDWCVSVANPKAGSPSVWSYSAAAGLQGPWAGDPC